MRHGMARSWTIGMVVVDSEARVVGQQMALVSTWQDPCTGFWRGRLEDADLVVARTAPGKVNAALATQSLLQRHRPDLLMSVGTAGAVGDLQVGDVVIATEVGWHDVGLYLDSRFVPFGSFVHSERKGRLLKDGFALPPEMEQATRTWADRWGQEGGDVAPLLVWDKVVTGDQVILSSQRKEFLRDKFGAAAVEMESAAVVQVASAWGVPWLVVRSVSDAADSETGFDFTPLARQKYAEGGPLARGRALGAVLRLTLSDPRWREKFAKVRRGIRIASANAAVAALSLAVAPEIRRCVGWDSTGQSGEGGS